MLDCECWIVNVGLWMRYRIKNCFVKANQFFSGMTEEDG